MFQDHTTIFREPEKTRVFSQACPITVLARADEGSPQAHSA